MNGRVLSIDRIIMTRKKLDLHGQTCPNFTLTTTNPTHTHTLPWYRQQILYTMFNLLFLNIPSLTYVICVVEKMSLNEQITS